MPLEALLCLKIFSVIHFSISICNKISHPVDTVFTFWGKNVIDLHFVTLVKKKLLLKKRLIRSSTLRHFSEIIFCIFVLLYNKMSFIRRVWMIRTNRKILAKSVTKAIFYLKFFGNRFMKFKVQQNFGIRMLKKSETAVNSVNWIWSK